MLLPDVLRCLQTDIFHRLPLPGGQSSSHFKSILSYLIIAIIPCVSMQPDSRCDPKLRSIHSLTDLSPQSLKPAFSYHFYFGINTSKGIPYLFLFFRLEATEKQTGTREWGSYIVIILFLKCVCIMKFECLYKKHLSTQCKYAELIIKHKIIISNNLSTVRSTIRAHRIGSMKGLRRGISVS